MSEVTTGLSLLDTTVLLTGGYGPLDSNSSGSYFTALHSPLDYITEYSEEGLLQEWPRLRQARHSHGCGRVGQVCAIL